MIICVEGGDCSGKTTLCRHLVEHHGARYMHARVWKQMLKWHSGIMRRAIRLSDAGELVVLDRHWVSDFIYGPIYRGEPSYSDAEALRFDRTIRDKGCYVLCVPSDLLSQLARHEHRARNGCEMFKNIDRVVHFYSDLVHGNMMHKGSTCLDTFVRFGDFMTQGSALRFDMDQHNTPEETARRIIMKDWR